MREIGRHHQLQVLEVGSHGAILDGGDWGRLSLALRQCPREIASGDDIDVFIYLDAEGNPTPTTQHPAAELGQVAWLKVIEANNLGAFVDWGVPKDLFIPFAEQQHTLNKGGHALVRVYLDNQGRLTGSTRIERWIKDESKDLKPRQKVSLIVADKTELGFKAVINHQCWGLLYSNELYKRIRKGQVLDGYIKRIREDGKIDLTLNKPGFSEDKMDGVSSAILEALEKNDGFLPLTDKSPPPEIYAAFGVSKKVYKQAIGKLYKQRRISLDPAGIRLL
jgi:predicted RNA-binding protein (virulence factor B family)